MKISLNLSGVSLCLFLCACILSGSLFSGCIPSCQEDSEAVAYVRSLSQDRLAKLYRDMEEYSVKEDTPIYGYIVGNTDVQIPSEFADLKVVKIRPRDANIMVEGCFDHYIYLTFNGFRNKKNHSNNREIVLNWGERAPSAGTQIIWSETVTK